MKLSGLVTVSVGVHSGAKCHTVFSERIHNTKIKGGYVEQQKHKTLTFVYLIGASAV